MKYLWNLLAYTEKKFYYRHFPLLEDLEQFKRIQAHFHVFKANTPEFFWTTLEFLGNGTIIYKHDMEL